VAAVLAELRLAALDLPSRHAVPSVVAAETRELPAYLAAQDVGRLISIAPTEYELDDHDTVDQRFPGLDASTMFNLKSALKLDEVMSPNIPLRYGLSTADGYDGGVLPLHRFLDLASLIAPRSELRTDGVLRTRLIALPETRLLDLLGIRAVIANRVTGRDLDGIHYDVATARQLQDGGVVHVRVDPAASARAIGLL